MAAIAPKLRLLCAGLLLAAASAFCLRGDDLSDTHAVIGRVAEALSAADASLAITYFSKSYPDYNKLNSDFEALTQAYDVTNQVDYEDDDIADGKATITVRWTLTLATPGTGLSTNRNAELTIKLGLEGKNWKIVGLKPISIFDPQ